MSALSWLDPGSVSALGWTLVHFVWQGAAAAAVLAAANALLAGRSPRARHAAALATLLAMLALPLATFAILQAGPPPPQGERTAAVQPSPRADDGGGALDVSMGARNAPPADMMPALVTAWAAGVGLLSLRTLGAWMVVLRLRRSGRMLPDVQALASGLARRMRLWRPVRVCESLLVEVPTAIGWLRPVVLLPPATLLGLSPAQLELVLAHELAHIRRFDALVGVVQAVAETVLFYHPLVWWVSHRLRVEREECCDDAAVAQCGNAVAYARTLAALEELRLAVPRAALGLGGGSLGERVRRLVAPGRDSASRWPAAVLVVIVLALALATPDLLRAALPGAAAVTASEEPAPVTEPAVASETRDVGERPGGEAAMAKKTSAWLAAGLAMAVSATAGQGPTGGSWAISPASGKHEGAHGPVVQLSLKMRSASGSSWNNSSSIALSELRGLRAEQLNTDGDVRFQIVRDAGTFDLEGRFRRGVGAGHFTFTPNAEFARALGSMGYGALDADQAFSLAVHDVSRQFIADLQALGYERVPLDSLVSLRIHGATTAFVREIKALGYDVAVDQLVSFRIHGVSPELVRALKDLGYERADADDLVSLRIHGVSPEFIAQLRELGYEPPPPLDALVSMRIHGATTEFLRALRELGYEKVPVDSVVSMRIHGVSPEFIRRANDRAGRRLPVDELVSKRIHGERD